MDEALRRLAGELEECGRPSEVVESPTGSIVAFAYTVPVGRYKGQDLHVGLGMHETSYPEYPPHWIYVTPKIEDKQGPSGKEFTDAQGRAWVGFSRPPSDFWDGLPTKHMNVYLREHLRRFWRNA